jgi:hypothetical protein
VSKQGLHSSLVQPAPPVLHLLHHPWLRPRAVSDAAPGGLITLSDRTFDRLRNGAPPSGVSTVVVYAGHFLIEKPKEGPVHTGPKEPSTPKKLEGSGSVSSRDPEAAAGEGTSGSPHTYADALPPDAALFLAVPRELLCRLVHGPALRTFRTTQLGSLQAPIGTIAVAFMKVAGASTLLADLPGPAARALAHFQRVASSLLVPDYGASGSEGGGGQGCDPGLCGFLVEGGDGLVLASFSSPLSAVHWALDVMDELQATAWEEELLAHEQCEEVRGREALRFAFFAAGLIGGILRQLEKAFGH